MLLTQSSSVLLVLSEGDFEFSAVVDWQACYVAIGQFAVS
jgi:hypothetical protein